MTETAVETLRQDDAEQITALLQAWNEGDRRALETLIRRVYDELKQLARQHLRGERSDHTLQPTALVHEAFLRLASKSDIRWQSRRHFFAVAARTMRRLLVDHARRRGAGKRGEGAPVVSLGDVAEPALTLDQDLLLLDLGLQELYQVDPLKAWIVELRFFGGYSVDDTAEIVGLSRATVIRHWRVARAWLYRSLRGGEPAAQERRAGHAG